MLAHALRSDQFTNKQKVTLRVKTIFSYTLRSKNISDKSQFSQNQGAQNINIMIFTFVFEYFTKVKLITY